MSKVSTNPKARGTASFAEVAPAVPLPANSPQTYTYRISPSQRTALVPYAHVMIPFGKRQVPGIVLDVHQQPADFPVKALSVTSSVRLTAQQVALARWIARTMQGGLGYTLRLFYPPSLARPPQLPVTAQTKLTPHLTAPAAQQIADHLHRGPAILVEAQLRRRIQIVRDLVYHTARQGQQTLVVVPEKWLIDPFVTSLRSVLGEGVAAMTADTSVTVQRMIWQRVASGQLTAIVGTQKALFLPYKKLGLVIVEEEQYATHKLWDQYPRLHNVYVAQQLASIWRSRLLLATSLPSLWSHYLQQQGAFRSFGTNQVHIKTSMIPLQFEDRRQHRLLPNEFVTKLAGWLAAGERILILHMRRGSWQTMFCRSCHRAVRCPDCQATLTVHGRQRRRQLLCHSCGHRQGMPRACPHCHKHSLGWLGPGTQTLEHVFKQLSLPTRAVLRLDADTLAGLLPDQLEKSITNHRLIIGTTAMLARVARKRFDRVVWLFPEISLLFPDFRSQERSYYLLARLQQLLPPRRRVVLVTRQPHLVEDQLVLSPTTFTQRLLRERRRLAYPPFRDLVRLTVAATRSSAAQKKAERLRQMLEERIAKQPGSAITIRGPYTGAKRLRRGRWEAHIILLGPAEQLAGLYSGLPVSTVDLAPQHVL